MSNLLEYINKTKTIDAKAQLIYNAIQQDYNNGVIKTQTEMLYVLKEALKEFYGSIGKPTFKFVPAVSTPISSDYNTMIQSAYNDLQIIIDDCKNLSDALDSDYIDIELSRIMMANQISYANKKLSGLQNKVEINSDSNVAIFTDSFINSNYMEGTMIESGFTNAFVNTVDGVLTLNTDSNNEYSSDSYVEVLSDSNGLPGNTHMVDILDNSLHFLGENGLHMDLNDIIDANDDTWFEYEMFAMDDDIINQCNNFGFNYKENIYWVTEDTSMTLKLKITLKKSAECNWLSLTPYIPESKGAKSALVKTITISDGDSMIQVINVDKVFDDNTVVIFTPQVVSFIIIEIEQSAVYNTNVGHFYFTKADTANLLVFDDISTVRYSRVDGVYPSINLLGMKYDPNTKTCIQPKNYVQDTNGPVTIDTETIKSALFTMPSDTNTVTANKEMLRAYRYSIGIRNVSVSNFIFRNNCEYISKPFTTNDTINSISLEANESIPKEFTDTGVDGWILYYISLDDGINWKAIFPKHRAFEGPCTMMINSETPIILRNPNVCYIDRLDEPTSLRLKIVLTRPDIYASMTPIIYDYKLKLLTGGDTVEY